MLALLLLVVFSGPACSSPKDEGPLKVARANFQQQRYAATLRDLSSLLSAPRVSKETLVLAIRAAIRARDTDRARELAGRLLSHPEAGADGPYYAGMAASSSGAFDKALSLHERALAADPRHQGARREAVRALCHLGRAAMRRQDLSAARRLMGRARRVDPEARVVDRNLALIELSSGRPEKAVVMLRRVLRRAPKDPVANRLTGRALAAMGKLKLAERHLEKAVAAGHELGAVEHARTLMVSGVVRARLGKLFNAMVDLTQAANELGSADPELLVQIRARTARVRAALGIEQLRRGKEQAALRHLRGALVAAASLSPSERAEIQRVVALGVAVRGKTEQAKKILGGLGPKVDLKPVLRAAYAPAASGLADAYSDYFAKDSDRRLRAAASFKHMAGKVAGPAREKLLQMAVQSQLRAAALLFSEGSFAEACLIHEQALHGVAKPPLAWRHNAAVLDYASGDHAAATAALGRLRADLPLAVCNLAVAIQQAYFPVEAYRLFKECKARGARFPGLQKILDSQRGVTEEGRDQ